MRSWSIFGLHLRHEFQTKSANDSGTLVDVWVLVLLVRGFDLHLPSQRIYLQSKQIRLDQVIRSFSRSLSQRLVFVSVLCEHEHKRIRICA